MDGRMLAEFEAWANANAVKPTQFEIWKAAYQAGQTAEREEVERLLTEFRHFIEEVEQTGIYYDNARVGTALANAWRVFNDIAAQIRNKPKGEEIQRKNEEWSKAVNIAWIETANERESQL